MALLTLDIETLPVMDNRLTEWFAERDEEFANIKAGGQFKNPESIAKEVARKQEEFKATQDEAFRKTALDPMLLTVFCISVYNAFDGQVVSFTWDNFKHGDNIFEAEGRMLRAFESFLAENNIGLNSLAGHNIIGFDIPALRIAFARHDINVRHMFDGLVLDTMRELKGYNGFITLEKSLKLFGIKSSAPEGAIKGDAVHEAFVNGEFRKIVEHCEADVKDTHKLAKRLANARFAWKY